MLLIYKNKGPLVILCTIVSLIGIALIGVWIRTLTGNSYLIDHMYLCMGLGLLAAAGWTWLTKDDYYENKEGVKTKMDTVNSLYFIPMNIWAIILAAGGVICLGKLVWHTINS